MSSDSPATVAATTFLVDRAPGILVGAVAFAVLTVLFTPWGVGTTRLGDGYVLFVLLVVVALALVPLARGVPVGFFGALLVASIVMGGFWSRIWWAPMRMLAADVTAPLRDAARRRAGERAWLASHRGHPLDVDAGVFRAYQLSTGAVRRALEDAPPGRFPTALEVTEPDDHRGGRGDALDLRTKWPHRFHDGDTGWRWSLAPSATPSWWGGRGFLLTLRPEPALGLEGPILELDGQALLRIRESATSPSRVLRTPVPVMRRLRECLLAAGAGAGDDALRWRYLPDGTDFRRACRDLRVEVSGSVPADGSLEMLVRTKEPAGAAQPWSPAFFMSYLSLAPGRFEVHATLNVRRYLLSADGTLHVFAGNRAARVTDPAPLPCELDPSTHCD